jgi:hypothetical protein
MRLCFGAFNRWYVIIKLELLLARVGSGTAALMRFISVDMKKQLCVVLVVGRKVGRALRAQKI